MRKKKKQKKNFIPLYVFGGLFLLGLIFILVGVFYPKNSVSLNNTNVVNEPKKEEKTKNETRIPLIVNEDYEQYSDYMGYWSTFRVSIDDVKSHSLGLDELIIKNVTNDDLLLGINIAGLFNVDNIKVNLINNLGTFNDNVIYNGHVYSFSGSIVLLNGVIELRMSLFDDSDDLEGKYFELEFNTKYAESLNGVIYGKPFEKVVVLLPTKAYEDYNQFSDYNGYWATNAVTEASYGVDPTLGMDELIIKNATSLALNFSFYYPGILSLHNIYVELEDNYGDFKQRVDDLYTIQGSIELDNGIIIFRFYLYEKEEDMMQNGENVLIFNSHYKTIVNRISWGEK